MDIESTQESKVHEAEVLAKEETHAPQITKAQRKAWAPKTDEKTRSKIVELAVLGKSYAQIAELVGKHEDTVSRILKPFKPVLKTMEAVADYRESKGDFLAAGQLIALETGLDETRMKKNSSLTAIKIFEVLNKAERLERDLSTENVAHKFVGRMEHTKITS